MRTLVRLRPSMLPLALLLMLPLAAHADPGDPCASCPEPDPSAWGVAFRDGEMWVANRDGWLHQMSGCSSIETIPLSGVRAYGLGHDSLRDRFIVADVIARSVHLVTPEGSLITSWSTVSPIPVGAAYDPTRDWIWIVGAGPDDRIEAYEAGTGTLTRNIRLTIPFEHGSRVSGCAYDAQADAIVYAGRDQGRLYWMDIETEAVIASVVHPGGSAGGFESARGVGIHPQTQQVWLSHADDHIHSMEGLAPLEAPACTDYTEGGGWVSEFVDQPLVEVIGRGSLAYVAPEQSLLPVLDVSPGVCTQASGGIGTPDPIVGLDLDGDLLVAADSETGLLTVDISETAPDLIGAELIPGGLSAVAVNGDRAVAIDNSGTLHVFEVSLSTSPTLLGSVAAPGVALDVAGDRVVVAGASTTVLDISNPLAMVSLGSVPVEDPAMPGRGVAIVGDHALVSAGGGAGGALEIIRFDSTPTRVARLGFEDDARDVSVRDGVAYVAAGSHLHVIDVQDPDLPSMIGSEPMLGAQRVSVSDAYVFVAGPFGLRAFAIQCSILGLDSAASPAIAMHVRPNPMPMGSPVHVRFEAGGSSTARVFDTAGRLVREDRIEGARGGAGWSWDGRDLVGRQAPPGVYFMELTSASGMTHRARVVRVP